MYNNCILDPIRKVLGDVQNGNICLFKTEDYVQSKRVKTVYGGKKKPSKLKIQKQSKINTIKNVGVLFKLKKENKLLTDRTIGGNNRHTICMISHGGQMNSCMISPLGWVSLCLWINLFFCIHVHTRWIFATTLVSSLSWRQEQNAPWEKLGMFLICNAKISLIQINIW